MFSGRTKSNNNLSRTKQSVSQSNNKTKINKSKSNVNQIIEEEEEIIFHVDWSDKYGIGYILSSGVVGFVFNDKTCLTKCKNIYYCLDKDNT